MKKTLGAILLALSACGKRPSDDECRAMLDRYVDMTIDEDRAVARSPDSVRPALREVKLEEKRSSEPYKTSLARCKREVSRAEFDCAMKAATANAWEACID